VENSTYQSSRREEAQTKTCDKSVSDEVASRPPVVPEVATTIVQPQSPIGLPPEPSAADSAAVQEPLRARLEWRYPFQAATRRKAKSSVTALRREAEALEEEAEALFPTAGARVQARRRQAHPAHLSAAEIGAAHHKFLEHFALEKSATLAAEAERLVQQNQLGADERAALDLPALAAFWNSDLGCKIREHREDVRRELAFTARFSPQELAEITGIKTRGELAQEFVIVQGVADLLVLRLDEIWLVDFKTDALSLRNLPEKIKTYAPQVRLYAAALEKIFHRKVTFRALHFLALGRTEEV